MATRLKRKLDDDDYARLPDDGQRYEILDGELYVTASPNLLHQRLSKRLQRRLEDYFMVVEILSPSTRGRDRGIKMRRYAALGVPRYWIVDPDAQTIECWPLESGEFRLVTQASVPDVLRHPDWPDLSIDLAALWR
jgi:Uma2 family endonuclease